jgi:chorismate mutase-like protein
MPRTRLRRALARRPILALAACASIAATPLACRAQEPNPPTPASAVQANRLDEIILRGVLRVGTTGDYKPFSYRSGSSDDFVGLDITLAGELAHALGVRLELVPTTWPTLMQDFTGGRFDIAMGGVSITLDRQKRVFFSTPYLRDGKTPVARCQDASKYQTPAQMDRPEVRLIVNSGGTNERFARANMPHAKLIVWQDNTTIYDRILSGDADVTITEATEARIQAHAHAKLCAIHPEAPLDLREKAVMLPRDVELKAFVDQWLHQTIESGSFARLNEQWIAYPWGLEPLRRLIDERLQLSNDIAQYKWNHGLPVEDAEREAEILANLATQAGSMGLPSAWVEAFFRAQMAASRTVQQELFNGWEILKRGPFPDAPDLATVTRPKLDRINVEMMHALADSYPLLSDPKQRNTVVWALRPAEADSIGEKAVVQALAPLVH